MLSRRKFLKLIAKFLFIIYFGSLLSSILSKKKFSKISGYKINSSEFEHKKYIIKFIKGKPIIILRKNGVIKSFLLICPHRGCKLSIDSKKNLIFCPCHGSTFNLDGKKIKGPAPSDLKSIKVEKHEGYIYVYI